LSITFPSTILILFEIFILPLAPRPSPLIEDLTSSLSSPLIEDLTSSLSSPLVGEDEGEGET